MKKILLLSILIFKGILSAQPGDPKEMILAEQQRRIELKQKLEKDPHNPKLLYEKVYQDLRTLNIDLYQKPYNYNKVLTADLGETAAQLDELINLQPQDAQHYFLRGNYQYFYGDVNNSVEDFEKALELSTDHSFRTDVFHKLSLCHYHIGISKEPFELDKCLVYIDSANLASEDETEPFERDKIYFLNLARKEAELHSYYKRLAKNYIKTCIKEADIKLYRFNDNFLAALGYLHEAANYQYGNKKFKKAIEILETCIDATPKNRAGEAMPNHVILNCHHLLSKIYREPEIDDYDKALKHIILALDEPSSWLLNEHELLKDLDYFLERSSDNPDLLIAKAIYYFKIGWQGSRTNENILSEQMDPLLDKALNRGCQSYKIPLMLSIRNRVYRQHDQALMYAKDAVEQAPDNYYCQAALYEALRNFPKTDEKAFQEIRKKIDRLYYNQKPDFYKILRAIDNL